MGLRGRPPKEKEKSPGFVAECDASPDRTREITAALQKHLQQVSPDVLANLVNAALNYELNNQIRHYAPLAIKRQGRRPELAKQWLLADCANAWAKHLQKTPSEILSALGGWAEDAGNFQEHPVIRSAEAILDLIDGESKYRAWRQQIRGAMNRLTN